MAAKNPWIAGTVLSLGAVLSFGVWGGIAALAEPPATTRPSVRINGDVSITTDVQDTRTTARNQADGTPSVVRNCVGVIGGGADVRIDGNVKITRNGEPGDMRCDCNGDDEECGRF